MSANRFSRTNYQLISFDEELPINFDKELVNQSRQEMCQSMFYNFFLRRSYFPKKLTRQGTFTRSLWVNRFRRETCQSIVFDVKLISQSVFSKEILVNRFFVNQNFVIQSIFLTKVDLHSMLVNQSDEKFVNQSVSTWKVSIDTSHSMFSNYFFQSIEFLEKLAS